MKVEPEPLVAWATDCRDKYASKGDSPQDKTYPGNHDSGYAGRVLLSDGTLAWTAVVSDGAGGSEEGLKISVLAVQEFISALRRSSLAELSDASSRDAWLRGWTAALHEEAWGRFKGGYATFCGAVVVPPPAAGSSGPSAIERPGWRLFTLNVGDSQILKLTGDGKCMGITPDAPPNNANVEGHNPIRVIGKEPKNGFALLDMEEFPLPASGPCWILAGSDGFFSKKRGKDEVCIFSSGDLRDVCLGGMPFQDLPSLAIRRSLANAQKLGCAEMMDNATVAMLGFRVPQTDLAAPAEKVESQKAKVERPEAGRASSPKVPQGGRDASAMCPPVQGGGSAGRLASLKAKSPVVAPSAAIVALAIGLLLGRLSAPAGKPEAAPEPEAPRLPDRVNLQGVPKEGRCAYCLELVRQGKLERKESFHWANECPNRAGGSGDGGGSLKVP